MVTKEQALTHNEFHANGCIRTVGPRGGETIHIEHWRRSGMTKTWKTRPTVFTVPIRFGMYHNGHLDHGNAEHFHTLEECPISKEVVNA